MIITTTTSIKDKRIAKYCGNVTGMEVFRGRTAFGSDSHSFHTCKGAMREMVQEAKSLGADAIVAVHIGFELMGRGDLVVAMTGTAVCCE